MTNTTIPDSTLKKKSQSITYHFLREGVAIDELRTAYINTNENSEDLLTKFLPIGMKRHGFIRMLLHHIFGSGDVDYDEKIELLMIMSETRGFIHTNDTVMKTVPVHKNKKR